MEYIFESYLKHIYQPNEYSCGGTCLKMLVGDLNREPIEDFIKPISNKTTGTVLSKIEKTLKKYNMEYEKSKDYSIENIKTNLVDNYIMMLVFVGSIPHWIIIEEFNGSKFKLLDPVMGIIYKSDSELTHYMEDRSTGIIKQGIKFLIPYKMVIIKKDLNFNESVNRNSVINRITTKEEKNFAVDIVAKQFEAQMSYKDSVAYINAVTNFNISYIATVGDEHVGVLLLGESHFKKIEITEDVDVDMSGKGLEGVALVIDNKFRNTRVISKLLYSLYKLKPEYNYITVQQFKGMEETMNYFNKTIRIIETNYLNVFYRKL